MTTETNPFRITVAAAAAQLPEQSASQLRFATLLRHGAMSVELYAPQGRDAQTPHRQDELYVVISGNGAFLNGGARHPFGPGDVLFVPAGVEHRFEDFSDDFQTWVIFYGPDGGEGSP
jgi:mannose-6-phosphate isomerase-like protein (cupin superfamily)